MELALLPLAAVLLLLSGARAPAPALSQNSPTAALMWQFFGTGGQTLDRLPGSRSLHRGQVRTRPNRSGSAHPIPAIGASLTFASAHAALNANPLTSATRTHKRYRTRFGFATGAYDATAPPLA